MKFDQETFDHLSELSKNDEKIADLMEWYEVMTKNPVYDSYVSRLKLLQSWDNEILDPENERALSLTSDGDGVSKAIRYMEKQPQMVLATLELRDKLTLGEANKATEDPRLKQGSDLAYPTIESLEKNGRSTSDNRQDDSTAS